jgi:outer membrane protein assembly factor BamB
MNLRFRSVGLVLAGVVGCKAIPLSNDPTMPVTVNQVSPPALWEVEWSKPLVKGELLEYQPRETAKPAIDPDTERIIVATRDGAIRCLSPIDGSVIWERKTLGRFFSGASVYQGVAYVPGGDGLLYAIRVLSGEVVWEFKSNEELITTPVVSEGRVLVMSSQDTLFAVDASTGKWVWQYKRDMPQGFSVRGASTPVAQDGFVYAGFADGFLAAVGLDDGVARWERKLTLSQGQQFKDVDSSPVLDDDGHLYAASFKDGVFALDAKTGDILWTSARTGVTSLILRGSVLFATGDGTLTAIDSRMGKALWSLGLSDRSSKGKLNNSGRAPVMTRGYIVVPTSTALAFVDPTVGKVRAAWNPGRGVTATPTRFVSARDGNRLYVLTNLGTLFALQMVGSGG